MCVPTPGSPNGPTAAEAMANTLNAMQPGSVPGALVGKPDAAAPAASAAPSAPGVNPQAARPAADAPLGTGRRVSTSATPFRSDLSIPTGSSSGAVGTGINIPR